MVRSDCLPREVPLQDKFLATPCAGPYYPMRPGPRLPGGPERLYERAIFYYGIINKTVQIPTVGSNIESIMSFPYTGNTLQTSEGAGADRGVSRGGSVTLAGPGPSMVLRRLCLGGVWYVVRAYVRVFVRLRFRELAPTSHSRVDVVSSLAYGLSSPTVLWSQNSPVENGLDI